jgi:hypothetical protein
MSQVRKFCKTQDNGQSLNDSDYITLHYITLHYITMHCIAFSASKVFQNNFTMCNMSYKYKNVYKIELNM